MSRRELIWLTHNKASPEGCGHGLKGNIHINPTPEGLNVKFSQVQSLRNLGYTQGGLALKYVKFLLFILTFHDSFLGRINRFKDTPTRELKLAKSVIHVF